MPPPYVTCSHRPLNAILDQGPPVVVTMHQEAGAVPGIPHIHRTQLNATKH